MKAYFDDDGTLCVDAENNTEAVALRVWNGDETPLVVSWDAHQRVEGEIAAETKPRKLVRSAVVKPEPMDETQRVLMLAKSLAKEMMKDGTV